MSNILKYLGLILVVAGIASPDAYASKRSMEEEEPTTHPDILFKPWTPVLPENLKKPKLSAEEQYLLDQDNRDCESVEYLIEENDSHFVKKIKVLLEGPLTRQRPVAFYLLGLTYQKGCGVKANQNLALKYFIEAAEREHPVASYIVTKHYMKSPEYLENHTRAVYKYLYQAMIQEHIGATFEFGNLFRHGWGAHQDNVIAAIYYQIVLNSDDPEFSPKVDIAFMQSTMPEMNPFDALAFIKYCEAKKILLPQTNVAATSFPTINTNNRKQIKRD